MEYNFFHSLYKSFLSCGLPPKLKIVCWFPKPLYLISNPLLHQTPVKKRSRHQFYGGRGEFLNNIIWETAFHAQLHFELQSQQPGCEIRQNLWSSTWWQKRWRAGLCWQVRQVLTCLSIWCYLEILTHAVSMSVHSVPHFASCWERTQ